MIGNEQQQDQRGAFETLRGLTETTRQGARAGTEIGIDVTRRAVEGTAEQAIQMVRQIAQAVEIYQGAAQRIAEEARALTGAPMGAAGAVQEMRRVWAEWLQRAVQTNLHLSQQAVCARSLPEIAEVHARFLEESLARLREGGAHVLEAAGGLAARAQDPLSEEDEGEPATVADVMTRSVRIASPEDTVQQAAEVMAEADTGVLPVGEDDRIVGMLTDRDLAVRLVAAGKDPAKAKVREVMTAGAEFCFEDEDLDSVVEKMSARRLRRLPVLDHEKRLVGIVSLGDLATEQPDLGVAGRALGGIAREGGSHRQQPTPRLVAARGGNKAAAARQQQRR
jgi:CBS domain-containing protein